MTEPQVFTRDTLPTDGWQLFRKTMTTRMHRIDGPFTVHTKEGPLTCPDGWLALDRKGWPYPISAAETRQHAEAIQRVRDLCDHALTRQPRYAQTADLARSILAALDGQDDTKANAHRGSAVETFIKRHRDEYELGEWQGDEWHALNRLLDDYRLHADTSTPLTEPTPVEGGETP